MTRAATITGTQVIVAMTLLDLRGATFEALPGGWFVARYRMGDGEKPMRWACRDSADDIEQPFARAFRNRVEGGRQ